MPEVQTTTLFCEENGAKITLRVRPILSQQEGLTLSRIHARLKQHFRGRSDVFVEDEKGRYDGEIQIIVVVPPGTPERAVRHARDKLARVIRQHLRSK